MRLSHATLTKLLDSYEEHPRAKRAVCRVAIPIPVILSMFLHNNLCGNERTQCTDIAKVLRIAQTNQLPAMASGDTTDFRKSSRKFTRFRKSLISTHFYQRRGFNSQNLGCVSWAGRCSTSLTSNGHNTPRNYPVALWLVLRIFRFNKRGAASS